MVELQWVQEYSLPHWVPLAHSGEVLPIQGLPLATAPARLARWQHLLQSYQGLQLLLCLPVPATLLFVLVVASVSCLLYT